MNNSFFALVADRMELVEERMRAHIDEHHPDLHDALDHLVSSGGKRVRPAVTLLTGGMLGADNERLITLAAAIEMLHTATLVHDDLIDGSLLRRGMPTINSQWSPAATVLAGDYIFARAAELAARTDSVAVMRHFSETLATIVNGEVIQLFASQETFSKEDYFKRIYAKTASMFVLATRSAALVSASDEQTIENVAKYGYEIGMAFQIVDDILDFTGEQARVGKPVASDLRQGLVTLPTLYFREAHPSDTRVKSVLEGRLNDEEKLTQLIESIRNSDAIERSFDDARGFVVRALSALEKLPAGQEHKALKEMGQYIIDRKV